MPAKFVGVYCRKELYQLKDLVGSYMVKLLLSWVSYVLIQKPKENPLLRFDYVYHQGADFVGVCHTPGLELAK